jgi:hypothetical protein
LIIDADRYRYEYVKFAPEWIRRSIDEAALFPIQRPVFSVAQRSILKGGSCDVAV